MIKTSVLGKMGDQDVLPHPPPISEVAPIILTNPVAVSTDLPSRRIAGGS